MSTAIPGIMFATAGTLAAVGVLIGRFGRVDLIAGYDPEAVTDEEGLATFVGRNVLYIALLTGIVAVVEFLQLLDIGPGGWIGYSILVGILSIWTARRARQF